MSEPMSKYLDLLAAEQGTTAPDIVRFLVAQTIEEFSAATDFAWDEVALESPVGECSGYRSAFQPLTPFQDRPSLTHAYRQVPQAGLGRTHEVAPLSKLSGSAEIPDTHQLPMSWLKVEAPSNM